MISLNNIALMRGSKQLLENTSVVFHDGQKTGVIGRNGSGKTSLFSAFNGELSLESGEISLPSGLRRATMQQETAGSQRSALDSIIDADYNFRYLESKLIEAEQAHRHDEIAKLHSELDQHDAYSIENRAQQLLSGLGFKAEQFDLPVSSFSGGWRVRLNLAAALMCPSDLLMLDEPTNHLDLEATLWLEQWLNRYQGILLVVSHDRSFLDKVVDHIVSFEGLQLRMYKGNYSDYEIQRAERMALQQSQFEKQQKRRAEIEGFVRRFRAKATKARQAQSRLKELNRMEKIAPAHVDSPFRFQFPSLERVPDFLLGLEKLSIGYGEPLVSNIDLILRSESRIGLLGFNGSGKSTLLKVIAGQLELLSGEMQLSKHLSIGYFAQHQVDELDLSQTPMSMMQGLRANQGEQQIRDYLGGFDFKGSRVDEKIGVFSGGEKARLALAKVAWLSPNLLLLDEPTNHLDLEMRHALTVALQGFEGAILMVSHDRHLLANTVDQFYSIHEGTFTEFDGDLHDYEKWLQNRDRQDRLDQAKDTGSDEPANDKVDKKEQRQLAAAKRAQQAPLRKKAKALEKQVDTLSHKLTEIEQMLSEPSYYEEANKSKLKQQLLLQAKLKAELAVAEELWMDIEMELEG